MPLKLDKNNGLTKVQMLVDGLSQAISQGIFQAGEALPSVNQISKKYNLSRDTVFKAYKELKQQGLVEATRSKGYFVIGNIKKVLLLLDIYSPFKNILYQNMTNHLPDDYQVDLVFHFYNQRLFENVIFDSLGRYNHYVIMNINNSELDTSLKKIPRDKLLLLDLGDFKKEGLSFIAQDFGESVYRSLEKSLPRLVKYKKIIMYYPGDAVHPEITVKHFTKFCERYNINHQIINKKKELIPVTGTAWFIIHQEDLVRIVKHCKENKLNIGKDIGLLAYNDMPIYEIIEDGISVISADFALMGQRAADFITTKESIHETIHSKLILRGSL
jgi:DNA-binding transcriptional regulator YhcF (GntR family)